MVGGNEAIAVVNSSVEEAVPDSLPEGLCCEPPIGKEHMGGICIASFVR